MQKTFDRGILALVLLLGLSIAAYAQNALEEGLSPGSKAPNILAKELDGGMFRLSKVQAKLKVINFWWILCIPCKAEMPEMAKLQDAYPDVYFAFVHTTDADEKEIRSFLGGLEKAPRNIVLSNTKVLKTYNFRALPHTVILDAKDKVKLVISGYREDTIQQVRAAIERWR